MGRSSGRSMSTVIDQSQLLEECSVSVSKSDSRHICLLSAGTQTSSKNELTL